MKFWMGDFNRPEKGQLRAGICYAGKISFHKIFNIINLFLFLFFIIYILKTR
jgi:hypothetical protein